MRILSRALSMVADFILEIILKIPLYLAFAMPSTSMALYKLFRSSRLFRPPGYSLQNFAELCFSKKTFTQVLEPALSDMQKEHFEALAADRPWKARMVLARGYWSFWSAIAAQLPISFARRVYEVWKATKTGS
jgi:hypothetical protein